MILLWCGFRHLTKNIGGAALFFELLLVASDLDLLGFSSTYTLNYN
jgi:hypothetical protein